MLSAYAKGFIDYSSHNNENPYPLFTEDWYDWEDGWTTAETEYNQLNYTR